MFENEQEKCNCAEGCCPNECNGSEDMKTTIEDPEQKPEKKEKALKGSKKITELELKLKKAEEKVTENYNMYLRCYAEFDNFKKRTLKEKEALYDESASDTVAAILPVLDNFDRALSTEVNSDDAIAFKTGIEMISKQLVETLSKLGVKEIETNGKQFDPNLHNAVMHIEDEELGEQEIVETFQKGYMLKDRVIRHSMVKVAN